MLPSISNALLDKYFLRSVQQAFYLTMNTFQTNALPSSSSLAAEFLDKIILQGMSNTVLKIASLQNERWQEPLQC